MKAGGEGFFAAVDTTPYQPRGVLIGQATDDSCVPACVRMLLLDEFPHLADDYRLSESFLRNALKTTGKGSSVAGVPAFCDRWEQPNHIFFAPMSHCLNCEELRQAVW